MKTTTFFQIALLLIISISSSCRKEENLDDRPFYCQIDGEEFLPNGFSGGIFSINPIQADYYPNENRFGFLVFNEKDEVQRFLNVVGFTDNDSVMIIRYTDLRNSDSCVEYLNIDNSNLKMNFESIDSTTGKIKMKFQADLVNSCGDTVELRQGHFNKVVSWNF